MTREELLKLIKEGGQVTIYRCEGIDYNKRPNMPIVTEATTGDVLSEEFFRISRLTLAIRNWEWAKIEDPYPDDEAKSKAAWEMYEDGVLNAHHGYITRNTRYFVLIIDDQFFVAVSHKQ